MRCGLRRGVRLSAVDVRPVLPAFSLGVVNSSLVRFSEVGSERLRHLDDDVEVLGSEGHSLRFSEGLSGPHGVLDASTCVRRNKQEHQAEGRMTCR